MADWTHQKIADGVNACSDPAIQQFKKDRDDETARLVEAKEDAADAELTRLQGLCGGLGHILRPRRDRGGHRCVVCLHEDDT